MRVSIAIVLMCGACSSKLAPSPDAGNGGGGPFVTSFCHAGTRAPATEVPSEHRATAAACDPTALAYEAGTPMSCATDTDCLADGSISPPFTHCVRGLCSYDECLSDADCAGTAVCACAATFYGGIGGHGNVCVPGNCRVDADCGSGGYCSPSRGYCGGYQGFYCHTSKDSCRDETKDCNGCGNDCVYMPTTGVFLCATNICAG
jgi:hypothetical protein